MSDKKPEPYSIAKNEEAMDTLRPMVKPELKDLADKIASRPASPEEQKVRDEMRKKIAEDIEKMKQEGRL